jgi:hypothetical protein
MAATNDATLRLLDARTCSFVSELKVVKVLETILAAQGAKFVLSLW